MIRITFIFALVPAILGLAPHRLSHRRPNCLNMVSDDSSQRNVFQNYDKPIVLVGCSGEGNELSRLAESFLEENFPQLPVDIMIPTADISSVVSSSGVGFPSVIVVDFSAEPSDDLDLAEVTQSLYEDNGLLSIYVNVDPKEGKMSAHSAKVKSELDESVFVKFSDYELCIKGEGTEGESGEWEHIKWELMRLIARARLAPAIPGEKTPSTNTAHLTMGENTFFLSLSFPEISQVEPYVEEMCLDVDAMEYRTDLLDCRDNRFVLIYGMQLLRRYCRPYVVRVPALPFVGDVLEDVMPICYTVRTQNQAGTYPDDEASISKMFDMLGWGLRGGVEVLDVESAWDKEKTDALLHEAKERYASQILGSHHVVGKEISREEAVGLFQQCALDGRAHGAKVVLSIESDDKDRMAHEAAITAASLAATEGKPVIPNISIILGDVGKFSRVINLPFTPVTHESLPFKAAPGQLTAKEIMASRLLMRIVEPKRYAILGYNIAYSVSPQMQGSAFAAAVLPHAYGRADVETVEEFVESDFFKDPRFGGCSVTIPHKQSIIPYVDVMSEAATAIGSVNTLIVEYEYENDEFKRVIYGDNTDWKGIFNPLERRVGVQGEDSKGIALILGGGGTARAAAFAASELGLKRIYYNRTPSKAEKLVESFGGTVITSLDMESENDDEKCLGDVLSGDSLLMVIISTLPAGAEFVLPVWLISKEDTKPVIFDVNYKPYHTKLLEQAEAAGLETVRGSEMLWEQGVGQFEAWTKRTAPYSVMKTVVLQNCLPEEDTQ